MTGFERHVFICTNRRPADSPKGCCAAKGAEELVARFKDEFAARGLKGRMRANSSGCLDHCASGATVVVYPEGHWYAAVTADDVSEIIESHLLGGRPVERLTLR